ncbi:hypothetical protein RFI_37569, partial [Reticulomyxa filosa]
DCLYQSNETKEHQEVCSILMNEQFNPKYSTMIPFMAGMLYDNIENGKDRSGSGLLYFWKLLHSSPPQLTPINQMMLFVHCLDACKADTESSFLSSMLKCCHEIVINLFKSWLIAWISFGKNKCHTNRYMDRSLNKMMETHLPTLQYVLVHRDIHSWIIDQLIQFRSKILKMREKKDTYYVGIANEFPLLPYLCISTETADIILQCFEVSIQCSFLYVDFAQLYTKLKEDQLDGVLTFLIIALFEKKKHDKAIPSLKSIVPKLNERQANDAFRFLMSKKENLELFADLLALIAVKLSGQYLNDAFKILITLPSYEIPYSEFTTLVINLLEGKWNNDVFQYLHNTLDKKNKRFSKLYAKILENVAMNLKGEHLDVALRCFMKKLHYRLYSNGYFTKVFGKISLKLNEEQLPYISQCLMDGLEYKNKYIHQECAKLLGTLSMKWNQVQLNDTFKCLMNRLNENVHWTYMNSIEKILLRLEEEYLDTAFQCLIDGLDNYKQSIREMCVNLLAAVSMQWNKVQLDTLFTNLITKKLLSYLDNKQINEAFGYLIHGLKDKDKNIQKVE